MRRPKLSSVKDAKGKASKKLKNLLKLPKKRPHPFTALLSVVSGTAMSWGVEVFDDDKLKDQAIQEATNTGLLTALLLTISAGPLLGDAPNFFESVQWKVDVWYALWFLSTIFLGLATVVSVMQNIMYASLSGAELRIFHEKSGVMMHAPLLLFISGTLLLLAAVAFALYYAVSFGVWLAMLIIGGFLVFMLLAIVTEMSLLAYDAYAAERLRQEEELASTATNSVQHFGAESDPSLPPVVELQYGAAQVVSNNVPQIPAYSIGES